MLKVTDLQFRYGSHGKKVLSGASLELGQGEVGILLGKNGSGKTTLFKNILGIEKPKSGTICFEGENLLKMNRRERSRRIAYVPQHIHFGDLTVFDSVLMGRVSYFGMKAGMDDYRAVEKILEDMHLTEFASRSAEALSGGEKQRISIARALMKDAPILILDDSVSAVDTKTERTILENLSKTRAGKTTILIAHRISTIEKMDKILFIDDGNLAAVGTHQELYQGNAEYRKMVDLQKLEEEGGEANA